MAQEIHITRQNLAQFQDYLLNLREPEHNHNIRLDLPLGEILKSEPDLNPAAQETLAFIIAYGHGYENHAADAETMLDLAERYPVLLGRTYQFSGNIATHKNNLYQEITSALQSRKFEQNIPAIYTLLKYDIVYDTGTGEIAKTSSANTYYLNQIFKLSREEYRDDQLHTSAREFISNLPTYKLLNFETQIPEFRAYIDEKNFGRSYTRMHNDMLDRMDPDKITEKTLAAILKNMTLARPAPQDTTNARTQAEKNANILPMYYTKVRDALLRLAEKQEIHDPNNHGRLKTLSQRYKELCAKLLNAKSWDQIDPYAKRGLIQEAYLTALQRDVIDGNTDKLSPDELQMVLNNDSNGFYVRKIDTNLLSQAKVKLTPAQRDILSAGYNSQYAIDSKHLSSRDKREMLDRMEQAVAADAPQREALERELAHYDQDSQTVTDAGRIYINLSKAMDAIQNIQQAYEKITRHFKDGNPNGNEASLASHMLEEPIYKYISGANQTPISMPDEGSLPIFGRSKEKDRRESMALAIKDLNKTLSQIARDMTPDILNIISKHKDNILNPDTLSTISGMMNGARTAADNANITFVRSHGNRPRNQIEYELKILSAKQQTLNETTTRFKTQQKRIRDLSKRHLGQDQEGKLVHITDDMTPEEKRKTRAKNKAALTDKLAARRGRKPAKNMAELLAEADNER